MAPVLETGGSYFYPRSPCGERQTWFAWLAPSAHFYPRSPCGERQNARPETRRHDVISIHALLAESDTSGNCFIHFSSNFYPRSPCGERRNHGLKKVDSFEISIHALLAESDSADCNYRSGRPDFYPRSPCGERRNARPEIRRPCVISIHALLAESDMRQRFIELWKLRFLSTLSLRRATDLRNISHFFKPFLSTLSLRRATDVSVVEYKKAKISIHALLAESDSCQQRNHQS